MKKIAIIGCGFSGTMTAVHLVRNATRSFELIMIGDRGGFNKGIAYHPYSRNQLLNVTASRMSAFQEDPDHFLRWISSQAGYTGIDRNILANSFLPRYLYGEYLEGIWKEAMHAAIAHSIVVSIKYAWVADLEADGDDIVLRLDNGEIIRAHYCVLATGNHLPGNPDIINTRFFSSPHYFRNPWDPRAVTNHRPDAPVLILGNGLTMADTVLALKENGFQNTIYTISPHGCNLLPHKFNGISYQAIAGELQGNLNLSDIFRIVKKHYRLARKLGFNAEPVIDGIRPFTQQLWQNLATAEKRFFLSRLRRFWDPVRHRIPDHIHGQLHHMATLGKLHRYAGKLVDISEKEQYIRVLFLDKTYGTEREMLVSAVINCTGPATDLSLQDPNFLNGCVQKGIVVQDEMKLGIMADPKTFVVYNASLQPENNLFAIGSLLKGVLWETTAVRELREQAFSLAKHLADTIQG